MKRLILVRHAKTEPYTDARTDFERKLKNRGRKDTLLVARDLQQHGIYPDLIISSPAVRAFQTAQLFAKAYEIESESIVLAQFVYDGDTTEGMLHGFATLSGEVQTVMVVGHNPDMATLSMKLSSTDFFHFPTCAVTVISFSVSDWNDVSVGTGRVERFVYPKMLKGI
jgi:phosphohistidine phosphatase